MDDAKFRPGDVVRVAARPNPMARGFDLPGYRGKVISCDDRVVHIREFETMAFRAAPIDVVSFGSGRTKVEKEAVAAQGKEARAASLQCACGCEGMTKGGGFIPGHDAKLKGAFLRIMKGKATPEDLHKLTNEHVINHPRVRSSEYLMFHLLAAQEAVEKGVVTVDQQKMNTVLSKTVDAVTKPKDKPKKGFYEKLKDGIDPRGVPPVSKAKPQMPVASRPVPLPCKGCNMRIKPHTMISPTLFECNDCKTQQGAGATK